MSSKPLRKAVAWIGRFFCKYRGRPLADALEEYADIFHRSLNNVDFKMERNGELRVLKILSRFHPKLLLDVGANKGDWCRVALALCPACTIHAFEIVPSTCEELVRNTKDSPNVIANDFGLSSEEGTIRISLGRDTSSATGCRIEGMQFHDEYYTREICGRTRKASDYLEERGIDSIDFVKIDVEGMDFRVIQGFGDRIRSARVVQFEYGIFHVASHDLLRDICMHFKNQGFVVGKIFPRTVRFFEYHFNMENFHGSNYLAVRSDQTELIRDLSRFGA